MSLYIFQWLKTEAGFVSLPTPTHPIQRKKHLDDPLTWANSLSTHDKQMSIIIHFLTLQFAGCNLTLQQHQTLRQ